MYQIISGAMLGLPWSKSLQGVLTAGAMSGSSGEVVNQLFNNAFGIDDGYNLKEIIQAGGIGAVASMIGEKLIDQVGKAIERQVAEKLAWTIPARKLLIGLP
jgi:hypothetical protein